MAGLIKRAVASARAAPWHASPAAQGEGMENAAPPPLEAEVARLQSLLIARDEELAGVPAAIEQARAAGVKAGCEAAEREIEETREAQLSLLAAHFGASQQAFAEWLQALEALSLGIAAAAIETMFGEDGDRQATVAGLIRRRLAAVDAGAVLAIEVARADFPDTREVAALAEALGLDEGQLKVSEELEPGDCRLRLPLGNLDIGLGHQWGVLRDRLEALAAGTPSL